MCRKDAGFARAEFRIRDLPQGATVATSSTRRAAQLRDHRPDLKIVSIRGNVPTRLRKLAQQPEIDAIILAAAGLVRLQMQPAADGTLTGPEEIVTPGLLAAFIPLEEMLPCVGQAAIGIERRSGDQRIADLCAKLNHTDTFRSVIAERAFLRGMGGGCQLAVAAFAESHGNEIKMRAVSFLSGKSQHAKGAGTDPEKLGHDLAAKLGGASSASPLVK